MTHKDYQQLSAIDKLSYVRQQYLDTYKGCYRHSDAIRDAIQFHMDGYSLNQYGYVINVYSGDYVLVVDSGHAHIYKKVMQ
jgi:hypothetical protein